MIPGEHLLRFCHSHTSSAPFSSIGCRRVLPLAPWERSICSCPTSQCPCSTDDFTAGAPSTCWRCPRSSHAAFVHLASKPLTSPKHCVRVRRTRLGDHVDTLSATFALARAFMFMGYLAEAEDLAVECDRLAAALLHASARARVRVAGMRAQLLEERGQLQEAEQR
jgi:hypothetical protein